MHHLQPNSTLQGGKYRIEHVLGQGGFGITYLAYSINENGYVAIKEFFIKELCGRDESTNKVITHIDTATIERYKTKFLKEARTLMSFSHRNIVRVFDSFEENDTAYYVMEYIEGSSLNDILRMCGKFDEQTAVGYILKVATALHYIHSMNINHLDVKPGNILLRKRDNEIVLIDFGTAKHYDTTTGGATTLTNAGYSQGYAAIEQYRQGGVSTFTPETDIYSLGATLYKMLTGQRPPEPSLIIENGLPALPSWISAGTRSAITAAMQINKAARPHSVPEFMKFLDGDEATKMVDGGTIPGNTPMQKNRNKIIVGIIAIIGFILICIINKNSNSNVNNTNVNNTNVNSAKNDIESVVIEKKESPSKPSLEESANQYITSLKKGMYLVATFTDPVRHCVYVHDTNIDQGFIKYDLKHRKVIDMQSKLDDCMGYVVKAIKCINDKIYIIANNNALSTMNMDLVLSYDTYSDYMTVYASGVEAKFKKGNKIEITERGALIKDSDYEAEKEYSYSTKTINLK